jgi:hypothetical protein
VICADRTAAGKEGPRGHHQGSLPQAAGQDQDGAEGGITRAQRDAAGDQQRDRQLQARHREPLSQRHQQAGQIAEHRDRRRQPPPLPVRRRTAYEGGRGHTESRQDDGRHPGPRKSLERHQPGWHRTERSKGAVLQVAGDQADRQRGDHASSSPQRAGHPEVGPPERAEAQPPAV